MTQLILIQPGATDLDDQGRVKGALDVPLSKTGIQQVKRLVAELPLEQISAVYSSPCMSARETAQAIAAPHDVKMKVLDNLCNLDLGLWQGKRIDEIRRQQPKAYRLWQEHVASMSPPDGESFADAQQRVQSALAKISKKHKNGLVAMVVPEPLASLLRYELGQHKADDLWRLTCDCASWQVVELESRRVTVGAP